MSGIYYRRCAEDKPLRYYHPRLQLVHRLPKCGLMPEIWQIIWELTLPYYNSLQVRHFWQLGGIRRLDWWEREQVFEGVEHSTLGEPPLCFTNYWCDKCGEVVRDPNNNPRSIGTCVFWGCCSQCDHIRRLLI